MQRAASSACVAPCLRGWNGRGQRGFAWPGRACRVLRSGREGSRFSVTGSWWVPLQGLKKEKGIGAGRGRSMRMLLGLAHLQRVLGGSGFGGVGACGRQVGGGHGVGLGAGRHAVPAGVAVVAVGEVVAHFEHAEHAAHFHRAVRAATGHHGQGVVGQGHVHLGHFGHALAAHGHVIGQQLLQRGGEVVLLHADHRRHAVAHGIHGVVRFVAVEGPVARVVGDELDGAHLPHGNVHRHFGPARALGDPAAIGADHFEHMAVQVNGVVGHGEVAHADAHALAGARHQRGDAGKGAAVPGPEVEVEHGVDLGHARSGIDVVGVDEKGVVAIDRHLPRVFGMDDEQAHRAHGHLHHFVSVRVVHEGAAFAQLEFIDEGLAGRDLRLRQPAHAVHAVGQDEAVPVHRGVLGQLVGDEQAHAVAFHRFDGGAGAGAVVAPELGRHAGRDFAHHGFSDEVKFLHAVFHAKGQAPAVEGDDRVVGPAGLGV